MQSRNGGWGAFDTDNLRELFNKIPFADMEAMLDQPTADLTGRHLELMGDFGYDLEMRPAKRGARVLEEDPGAERVVVGSLGRELHLRHLVGARRACARSVRTSISPTSGASVAWLKSRQNDDGGWGETCDSYGDASLGGSGPSTPSQTAWALLGSARRRGRS